LNCFTIETYVYLPAANLTYYQFTWVGNTYFAQRNAICGSGGPNSGGMNLAIYNVNKANPRLRIYNANDQFLESNILFPLDQWVKVKVSFNRSSTLMYINDVLVGSSNTLTFPNISNYGPNFFIGARDNNFNKFFNHSLRGYISDFVMSATSTQPCPPPPLPPSRSPSQTPSPTRGLALSPSRTPSRTPSITPTKTPSLSLTPTRTKSRPAPAPGCIPATGTWTIPSGISMFIGLNCNITNVNLAGRDISLNNSDMFVSSSGTLTCRNLYTAGTCYVGGTINGSLVIGGNINIGARPGGTYVCASYC
jgi:hypothetical protein